MSDPYCYECGQLTGGCWRHNGTGIYTFDENGQLRKTHAPAVIVKDGTSIYYLEPIAVPFEVVNGVWK
jgi:hypothetical protein